MPPKLKVFTLTKEIAQQMFNHLNQMEELSEKRFQIYNLLQEGLINNTNFDNLDFSKHLNLFKEEFEQQESERKQQESERKQQESERKQQEIEIKQRSLEEALKEQQVENITQSLVIKTTKTKEIITKLESSGFQWLQIDGDATAKDGRKKILLKAVEEYERESQRSNHENMSPLAPKTTLSKLNHVAAVISSFEGNFFSKSKNGEQTFNKSLFNQTELLKINSALSHPSYQEAFSRAKNITQEIKTRQTTEDKTSSKDSATSTVISSMKKMEKRQKYPTLNEAKIEKLEALTQTNNDELQKEYLNRYHQNIRNGLLNFLDEISKQETLSTAASRAGKESIAGGLVAAGTALLATGGASLVTAAGGAISAGAQNLISSFLDKPQSKTQRSNLCQICQNANQPNFEGTKLLADSLAVDVTEIESTNSLYMACKNDAAKLTNLADRRADERLNLLFNHLLEESTSKDKDINALLTDVMQKQQQPLSITLQAQATQIVGQNLSTSH